MSIQISKAEAEKRRELNRELKSKVIEGLELPTTVDFFDDDQPLFGRGLELDSLDTLEIVSIVEETYGVYITDDLKYVFGSINKLCDFILANQEPESDNVSKEELAD